MKSSFYATGHQTQSPENATNKNEEEPGQKKRKLDSENNLREILREAKEEEERWELAGKAIFEKSEEQEEEDSSLPTNLSDGLVGGTIILPPLTEPSTDGKISPDLSLRASMVDTSILAQNDAEHPDDISILGSTTESIVIDDVLVDAENKDEAKDEAKKEEDGQPKEEAKTVPTNHVVEGGEVWGASFEAIGKQMYLSDTINAQAKLKENDDDSAAPKFNKTKVLCLAGIVSVGIMLSTLYFYGGTTAAVEPSIISPIEANSPDNAYDFAEDFAAAPAENTHPMPLREHPPTPIPDAIEMEYPIVNVTGIVPPAITPGKHAGVSVTFPPANRVGDFGGTTEMVEETEALLNVDLLFSRGAAFASTYFSAPVALAMFVALITLKLLSKSTTGGTDTKTKTKTNRAMNTKGRKYHSKPDVEKKKRAPLWLMRYHDMANIFLSMYKTEVVTKRGNLVEVKRSARILKLCSSIKHD